MKLELIPKLAQQQTLSPKMLLSMKVLPLTNMELEAELSREVAENPALELIHDSPEVPDDKPEGGKSPDIISSALRLFQPFQDTTVRFGNAEGEEGEDIFADLPAPGGGLVEHLTEQISLLELDDEVRETAEEILGNLDWRGYLLFPPEEIKASLPERLRSRFEEALELVKSLDPAGVGAEDLRECLLLQLRRREEKNPDAERIVRDHFDLLLHNRIPQLAERLGRPVEEIRETLSVIGRLSTRPGAAYFEEESRRVRPDVLVEEGEHGWRVKVLKEGLPRLQLSEAFKKLLSDENLAPEATAYLKKKLESAQWLIQALDGRRRTLKDIVEAIMEFQQGFLEHGPSHIVPLRMQTVADTVGVHVSTVSRAVKGKYVETPWGTFPLRFFFGGGVREDRGGLTSRHTVKEKISEIINKEDKKDPISDGELAARLRAQGFRISRRTVSKYRTSINIPPANLRKVF